MLQCEVLQAKVLEKEREMEESKQRIKDLEQLLFSRHSISRDSASSDSNHSDPVLDNTVKSLRRSSKVTKQYSQDECSPVFKDQSTCSQNETYQPRVIPDLKVTRPSETSDDESETEKRGVFKDDNCIKTSKITNISCRGFKSGRSSSTEDFNHGMDRPSNESHEVTETNQDSSMQSKIQRQFCVEDGSSVCSHNIHSTHSSESGHFSSETSVNHQIFFNSFDELSFTTNVRDELYLNDAFTLDVHTIPEENEDDEDEREDEVRNDIRNSTFTDLPPCNNENDTNAAKYAEESPCPNSIYRDLDPSDQEVKLVRSRIRRSASTGSGLYRGTVSNSNALDMNKLYSSLDEANLDLYESGSGMHFLRLGSVDSCFSDETNSRRNSCNWDSELEADSEEDLVSS